jgi:hypothetical protein
MDDSGSPVQAGDNVHPAEPSELSAFPAHLDGPSKVPVIHAVVLPSPMKAEVRDASADRPALRRVKTGVVVTRTPM